MNGQLFPYQLNGRRRELKFVKAAVNYWQVALIAFDSLGRALQ